MKTTTTMKTVLGSFAVCLALGAAAADISGVTVRQRWPWNRLVDIDYVIADATQAVDIAVTAYNGSTPLTLSPESISGDLNGVTGQGTRRIIWDPTQSQYTNEEVLSQFKVTLTASPSPLYMIVDLTLAPGAEGQIEYIYPGDARLVTEGRYTNLWFNVTNDAVYATDKLVLRRIHAGTFTMGGNGVTSKSVTLTKPFYVGIFETTQRQWEHVMGGSTPAYFNNQSYYALRPLENKSYVSIRGSATGTPNVNWPATGYTVSPSSFMGQLRDKTGGKYTFDLPTDAQWEYACRAGTTTYYHDDNGLANITGSHATSNEWLDALGRYKFNGGYADGVNPPAQLCEPTNGTAVVGSYAPNAWGIYDTHGNVWEWVLDWLRGVNDSPSGIDPTGLPSASARMRRGGSYDNPASDCRPVSLGQYTPESYGKTVGFRIVMVLQK